MATMSWGGPNYSTNEQVVGTWIDGKPIYQKTYYFAGPYSFTTSGLQVTIESGFSTTKKLIFASGVVQSWGGPNSQRTLPFVWNGGNATVILDTDLKMDFNRTSGTVSLSEIYATIQYTKTTD